MLRRARPALSRQLHHTCRRSSSLFAWGRNKEGQCGVGDPLLLTEPTQVSEPSGLCEDPPRALVAGRQHSALVLPNGEVLTWGNGAAGKLGLGTAHDICRPTRVESFVGRHSIKGCALGHQHTLFLDDTGSIWGCGENKEGQCGLGTSLETMAAQRRAEWAIAAARGQAELRSSSEAASSSGKASEHAASLQHSAQSWQQQANTDHPSDARFAVHRERIAEMLQAQRLWAGSGRGARKKADEHAAMLQGVMPGQLHTPVRVGRDLQHPLSASGTPAAEQGPQHAAAAQIAASRFFSAFIDVTGSVYTFGGGFNGELGHQGSWTPSPRRVSGEVQRALQENGGAVEIAAGATFCICRTGGGRALLWGGLHAAGEAASQGTAVVEVMGIPSITHIAAGHSHAIFSDGERVWALGQWLSADGARKVGPGWKQKPQEMLHLADEGIASLAAGLHSSAAISSDGRLYMWGSLMCKDHAEYLTADGPKELQEDVQRWHWAGMGADVATAVPGLSRVSAFAMGSLHAMAVTD